MAANMKEKLKMKKGVAKASIFIRMEIFMQDNGKMIYLMGKEYIYLQLENATKDNYY